MTSSPTATLAVAATAESAWYARLSVAAATAAPTPVRVVVLDLDGVYRPLGDERVLGPDDLGLGEIRRLRHLFESEAREPLLSLVLALALADEEAAHQEAADQEAAAASADAGGAVTVALAPGVLVIGSLAPLLEAAVRDGVAVLARGDVAGEPVPPSAVAPELVAIGQLGDREMLRALVARWELGERVLDAAAAKLGLAPIGRGDLLVSRWGAAASTQLEPTGTGGLRVGEADVVALDARGFDPERGLLDVRDLPRTGPLLSRNPRLAEMLADLVAQVGAREGARGSGTDLARQAIARELAQEGRLAEVAVGEAEEAWLLERVPSEFRKGMSRYLAGVYLARPDLRSAFPAVPGRDTEGLARWALEYGVADRDFDGALLRAAAERTLADLVASPERTRGVNVVGFLAGDLGIGESARQLSAAVRAAGEAVAEVPVSHGIAGRATAPFRARSNGELHDTTMLCVNADYTEVVAKALAGVVEGSHRIGFWYWEVEAFPASYHGAFASLDEVWVATDFVRRSIEPHSPVPVRVVLPPLPQRDGEPGPVPERLGIPAGRPWFLFSFDFLSTVERKNPLGVLEAFRRAFPRESGPMLVLKSINAHQRPEQAELLRRTVAQESDVILIEETLSAPERDALTAGCTAYVSLHRAEGLGLTMAEAMAWGRPVIATRYSGNLSFMNDGNAFLVPYRAVPIPVGCEPYPAGTLWAEPDLDAAAAAMRQVVEDPAEAARRAERAAADIAELHSVSAAARGVAQALRESRQERAARAVAAAAETGVSGRARQVRRLAGRARRAVLGRVEGLRRGA